MLVILYCGKVAAAPHAVKPPQQHATTQALETRGILPAGEVHLNIFE
jgi:NaMN:DMB phosphoribosyltransferase